MASDNKARFLRDAEKYVLHGKIPQAIGEYLKIIKNEPNDVLTLNTVGDLYLRQGKTAEANRLFSQVAENYTRNNFLQKAIAVYRKILDADPRNADVNWTLASLYAKQGKNVSARTEFLRVAEILATEGRSRESREAFEKVAELDPSNSAVQLRIAEACMAEGNHEKACVYYSAAARALVKAEKPQEANDCYKRALKLNPVDRELLQGFLDSSVKAGEIAPAVDQLIESLKLLPDDLQLQEMLGHAYLAMKDCEKALEILQHVLSLDQSRYENLFAVSKVLIETGAPDRAAACLDPVLPILISRRETERAVEIYKLILEGRPDHVLALTKLAEVYSATNAQSLYLEKLDELVSCYLSRKSPGEALEYLEKILQILPESERHLTLHRQAFAEAFPDVPYKSPVTPPETFLEMASSVLLPNLNSTISDGDENPATVEADLLMNYGMNEKALSVLLQLEAQNPWDKKVRTRLVTVYRDSQQLEKAAEQCVLLAAVHSHEHDEESTQKYLSEAQKLSPGILDDLDLGEFAREHGVIINASDLHPGQEGTVELDLSEDLSEMFFKDEPDAPAPEMMGSVEENEADPIAEDFIPPAVRGDDSSNIEAQLQEADFYIRLGFKAEARAKLDEIAKNHPDDPQLLMRYEHLAASGEDAPAPAEVQVLQSHDSAAADEDLSPGVRDLFADLGMGAAIDGTPGNSSPETAALDRLDGVCPPAGSGAEQPTPASQGAAGRFAKPENMMFADLMQEVNTISDREVARDDFETHFGLGIAYREMSLIDDAIMEFQSAMKILSPAKDPKEAIQCCGMLSTCFLEKGMPRSAIRWCQTGLAVEGISSHEQLALQYELGLAYSTMEDVNKALECFGSVFSIDSSYRDVAQKIDDLRGGLNRHGP